MLRIGQGFDLHQLVTQRKLILGGVIIPFDKGLLGHSDADVLIHAIIDGLLGALAIGDIGQLFPDTSPQFKDIDSRKLLVQVMDIIKQKQYCLVNLDATIILEAPKLSPYIQAIRENIALDLDIDISQVSIKAKTSEGVGIVGRGEAAIAQVIVLLQKNNITLYN